MLEQLLRAYLESNGIKIPNDPAFTLQAVNPEGRIDVAASNSLALLTAQHPLAGPLFAVFRPVIDGQLTQYLGPARVRPMVDEYVEKVPAAGVLLERFQQ